MARTASSRTRSPAEDALKLLGARWSIAVLQELSKTKACRFSQIERALSGISPRTLSMRLASFESFGILERVVYPEAPPRVEYRLTTHGKALGKIVLSLGVWAAAFAKDAKKGSKKPVRK